jgi:hypothetical protein
MVLRKERIPHAKPLQDRPGSRRNGLTDAPPRMMLRIDDGNVSYPAGH